MAREISLSKRLKIVEFVPSGPGSTRAFCRRMGVSLRSFYRIRSRWSGSGTSSLHPASRAPRRPRRRYGPDVEAAVAAGHAELTGRGLDAGGITIRFHLQQQGMDPLPSVATINRILARNGLSRVQRAKRPRSSHNPLRPIPDLRTVAAGRLRSGPDRRGQGHRLPDHRRRLPVVHRPDRPDAGGEPRRRH